MLLNGGILPYFSELDLNNNEARTLHEVTKLKKKYSLLNMVDNIELDS